MKVPGNTIPLVAAVVLLTAQGAGCRPMMRLPAEEPERSQWTEQTFVDGMNVFLLTDLVAPSVVVEVDWVEGRPPSDEALEALQATLERHGPEGKRIRVERDDEIPLDRWRESAEDRRGAEGMASMFLNHDPADWTEEELLYVLYVPDATRWFHEESTALYTQLTFEREGEPRTVATLLVFSDRVRKDALLWVTPNKVERSALIHELGHALGLVSRPGHVQRDNAHHCTEPQCVMTQPEWRTQVYNAPQALFAGQIPDDYCKLCREDIDTARRTWEIRVAVDPDYAEKIRRKRRISECRFAAHWYLETDRPERAVEVLLEGLVAVDGDSTLESDLLRARDRRETQPGR